MSRRFFMSAASGLGIASLAMFFVGLTPFLSADPSAAPLHRTPVFSVNRAFKGDRLPIAPISAASNRTNQGRHPGKIPVGCDASFSPVSAPRLAYIYGRCIT
jgi:hypothetical protein